MKKNNKGFSLLELIIVIGILMIFSGMSLSYYNDYSEGIKLEGVVKNFTNALALASKKAQAAELAELDCSLFLGYIVRIENDSSYILKKCCNSLNCSNTDLDKIYTLPPNIKIISVYPPYSILYKKLSNGIIFNKDQSITGPVVIIFRNTALHLNNKQCVNVTINKTGLVEVGQRDICL